MTETDILKIWEQIDYRTDTLVVKNLHFLKCVHPNLANIFLITWDYHHYKVSISYLKPSLKTKDHTTDITNYRYLVLEHENPTKRILLKIVFEDDNKVIHLVPVFGGEEDGKKLLIYYVNTP
ncbi:hypothetical protein [Sediminitomix flava]|uniref:Uncharacterized protein n=1 Tax=Sediminitomix flava TaxID=379075 RepID=A0A315ZCL8_SEDFL|nr:hypothetical protein [Sediminitomix flava]PWJ42843.1 hypothetical protein BC781_102389 [Sediminitomix flava]